MNLYWISLIIAALFCAAAVKFVFNPLGLGPEPERVLPDSFFDSPAGLDELNLLIDGQEAFGAALSAIDSAKTRIVVQTFIWKDDEIGREIVQRLISAADRGVQIVVNKDLLGTFFELGDIFAGKPSPVFANAQFKNHPNISVTVTPFKDGDHSKYFVIDQRAAIFGGMNIADEYHRKWHDYMVSMKSEKWANAFENKLLSSQPWPAGAPFHLASNDRRATEIRTALIQVITRARESVILEHAYFSDGKVIAALIAAMERGVNVTVILPESPDTHLYANRKTCNILLATGHAKTGRLKIYLYPQMTHAKVALIDGVIAAAGSANLTPRSMFTTREATLFAHGHPDEPYIKRLRDRLSADIAEAKPVTEPFKMTIKEQIGAITGKYIW